MAKIKRSGDKGPPPPGGGLCRDLWPEVVAVE